MYRRYFIPIFVGLYLFTNTASAQISDSLYKALPAAVRPLNKTTLTINEKRQILLALDDIDVFHYGAELRLIATYLETDAATAKYADITINDLNALVKYYSYFIKDSIIPANKRLLSYINNSGKYNKIAATAYLNLGEYYAYGSQHDSAINTLHAALNLAAVENDSTAASNAYSLYSLLYSVLYLYDSSIYYEKLALRLSPVKNKWNLEYTQNVISLAVDYVNLYSRDMQNRYIDSAHKVIYTVMGQKKNESQYWYGACFFLLGHSAYLHKDYVPAIAMFDSSLLPVYNRSSKYYANYSVGRYLYKAECLIKLHQFAQGKKILDNIKLPDGDQPTWHQLLYQALNEYAEGIGDYKNALLYYKKYKLFSDTFDLQGQRGRLFEAQQKYLVKEKEADIAVLENKNLQALATRNKIVAVAVIALLLLGAILYVRSTRQRHQRELALANQRKTISANMHNEVNSGLAALRYLIADLKDRANSEETKTVLADIEEEALNVYTQGRNFMHQVYDADTPDDYEIMQLLHRFQLHFNDAAGLKITVDADEGLIGKYFTKQQHIELSRTIKEAVANTMKYSGATLINIAIQKKGRKFYFEIKDNGRWVDNVNQKKGMGLLAITQHIEALNGRLQLKGGPDGTVISGSFPVRGRWW